MPRLAAPRPYDKGGKGGGKGDKPKGKGKGDPGKSKGKAERDQKRGNFRYNRAGQEICFSWNRDTAGCTQKGLCPAQRAHVCEWCLGGHRGVACTKQS